MLQARSWATFYSLEVLFESRPTPQDGIEEMFAIDNIAATMTQIRKEEAMQDTANKSPGFRYLATLITAALVGSLLSPLVFSVGSASGNGGYYFHSNYTNGPSPIQRTETLLREVFTRDGYTLAAWTDTPDGRGGRWAPNESTDAIDSNVYAQWRKTVTATLYRNWEAALPSGTRAPRVGQIIYASAFERELSRGMLRDAPRNELAFGGGGAFAYKTPEEYVYRVTTVPNSATASVDRQSNSGYTALSNAEQEQWYTDMGYNPYIFSWVAFMCVSDSLDISGDVERSATKATRLSVSYASREDGIRGDSDAGFESAYNVMFRDLTEDLWSHSSRSTRTVVGVNDFPYTNDALVGGPDVANFPAYGYQSWSVLDVVSNCGFGKTFEALGIVGSDLAPIITKSFEIPSQLTLDLGPGVSNRYLEVSSSGVTIGVTGGGGREMFNAALWGLTTIARTSSSTGAAIETNTSSIGKTKSALFKSFDGNSSKLPTAIRKGVVKFASDFQGVSSVACTGYSSGLSPSSYATSLARKRAKAACDLVTKRFPDAKVKLVQKPAKGLGAQFRSVRIRITGN